MTGMAEDKPDVKAAWQEAGERLTGLGHRFKEHYAAERGGEGDQTRQEVKDALHKLGSAIEDAFDALSKAARDPAVKDDVKQVGQSLAGAMGTTLGEVSEELQKAFRRTKGEAAASKSAEATGGEPGSAEPGGGEPGSGPAEGQAEDGSDAR
jgi:hypothetical protein